MRRIISSVVDIRKGEGVLITLMFSYYYLILVTYYLLKPARDSLFLVRLGPNQLPFVFILIALIVVPVTMWYARSARSFSLTRVMNVTIAVLIVNLLLLRWLIQLNQAWVYFVFYIWVSIFAILGTSQFWLLANTLFDPAQAKRVFWFLNLGGILGAMTGGEVTSLIVRRFGVPTENLLFVCMGVLASCLVVLNFIGMIKRRAGEVHQARALPAEQAPDTLGHMVGTIRRSKQLMYVVGILSIAMMMATFVDFQFKTVAVEAFPEQEDLTSFLGKFYGRLSVISLLIQSLFTYRILRVLGVGGAISFLPVGLLVGSIAMMIAPGLWAGVILRGTDGSFRYSIDKTARELLFLPVPLDVKKRTKVFIDMFLDRFSRGIGGVLLLVFTVVLDLSLRQISMVVLPLLVGWILFTILVRKEYVDAFRKALERRDIDPNELNIDITEAATVNALVEALGSPNERLLVYALEMLASVENAELVPAVRPLLRHPSSEVRRRAVRLLKAQDTRSLIPDVEDLLNDDDPQVRLEAMSLLVQHEKGRDRVRIKKYLEHPDLRIQAAAVQGIAEYGRPDEQHLIQREVIERLLRWNGDNAEVIRAQAANALGALGDPNLRHFLLELMDDSSPLVVRQVIHSAGQARDRQFVPWLLTKLSDTQYRADARRALAAFTPHILGTLHDYLTDGTVDLSIRMNIPKVFSSVPSQRSVDILTTCIDTVDPVLQLPVIKVLNKLRVRYPDLRFDKRTIDVKLIEETKSYYEILQILHTGWEGQVGAAKELLKRALHEKLNRTLEVIFRLLGLRYPPMDMYSAYHGLVSGKKGMHANAIEFLDSVLGKDLKRYLMPILDQISTERVIQKGQELFGLRIEQRGDALASLIRGRDPWLRACAIYTIPEFHSSELLNLARKANRDRDPVVREIAEIVVHRVEQ